MRDVRKRKCGNDLRQDRHVKGRGQRWVKMTKDRTGMLMGEVQGSSDRV